MAFLKQSGDDIGMRRLGLFLAHMLLLPNVASAEQAAFDPSAGLYLNSGGALAWSSRNGERPQSRTGGLNVEGGVLVAGDSSYVFEVGFRAQEGEIRERAALGGIRLALLPWGGTERGHTCLVARAAFVVGARYDGPNTQLSVGPRVGFGVERRLAFGGSLFLGADAHVRVAPFTSWFGFTLGLTARVLED